VAVLLAHDCRYSQATQAARNGTAINRFQDAGGWNSPAMPLPYVECYPFKTVNGKNNQPHGTKSSTDRLISKQVFFAIL
jgi:hypothetical protein